MGRALWIPDKLKEYGLKVVEVDGWQTRGSDDFAPRGLVCHHTASSASGGNAPSLGICVNGRSDLPGPLCQVLLARDGTCYVIASGRANHAGEGGYKGLSGNSSVLGIEAENNGIGEPWNNYEEYVACAAALRDGANFSNDMICGHKEWTRRKIDPHGIDMNSFRHDVSNFEGGWLMGAKEDIMAALFKTNVNILKSQEAILKAIRYDRKLLQNAGVLPESPRGDSDIEEALERIEQELKADG